MSSSSTVLFWDLGIYVLKSDPFLCLLFWNRPCFQDLLDPLGRWLNPRQVWLPHLLVEVVTRSMLTRWSVQTPGTRSLTPFYSLWARFCPASPRTLSKGGEQRALLKKSCRRMRRWLSSQPRQKQLPSVRTWRGTQEEGFLKQHKKQHPLPVQATPGVASFVLH